MRLVLEMPPRLGEVDQIVTSLCRGLAGTLPQDKLSGLEIAVTEALANAVTHGDAASGADPIRVIASAGPAEVRIEIIDAGRQGPEDLYQGVGDIGDVDPLAENGRGLSLICHFVDGVTFEPGDGANRLELLFQRGVPA